MHKGLVALALLLLVTGLAVLFLPLYIPAPPVARTEFIGINLTAMQATLLQIKQIAEQINAPLSVIVALMSLYYSRRGYQIQKRQAGEE